MSGKVGGIKYSIHSGLGSFGLKVNGFQVAALAVVNPLGSIVDPWSGKIISGLKLPDGRLADRDEIRKAIFAVASGEDSLPGNTVLVVVATDASLTKLGAYRLAMMASSGLGRAVFPAHTMFDGDIVYALSTGTAPVVDPSWLGSLAADVVSQAIVNSVIVGK
jgi:L-aminopeptidase/D-esterase-like protein